MNILIIEDDIDFQNILKKKFEKKHHIVHLIKSLAELNTFSKENDITHSIIDLRVGIESGLDFISLVKNKFPKSFILLLTAYGSITTSVEAIKRGADDYILKPCRFDDLYQVLLNHGKIDFSKTEYPMLDLYQKEKEYIDFILQQNDGNISKSAEVLGIRRQSLQRKLKKYSLKKIE